MVEAAITEIEQDYGFENRHVASFCNGVGDARIAIAVAALAQGQSYKLAAAAAGVNSITLWRWCKQYPIEAMAAAEAETRARPALLRMTAKLEAAAEVLARHVDGEIAADDIEVERLRASAAKTLIGLVRDMMARSAEKREAETVRAKPGHARAAAITATAEQPAGKAAAERLRKR